MPASRLTLILIISLLLSKMSFGKESEAVEVSPKEFTLGEFAFSPDAKWLVTCGKTDAALRDDVAYVWNTNDGSLIKELVLSGRTVGYAYDFRPVFFPNGKRLRIINNSLRGPRSERTLAWDTANWNLVNKFDSNINSPDPSFSPDGSRMIFGTVVAGSNRGYPIIDTRTQSQIDTFPAYSNSQIPGTLQTAFSPHTRVQRIELVDNNLLIVQREPKSPIEAWSIAPLKQLRTISDESRVFRNWKIVDSYPKKKLLTSVQIESDNFVQVRDPETGQVEKTYIDKYKDVFDKKYDNDVIVRIGYQRREKANKKGDMTHFLLNLVNEEITKIKVFHVHYGNSLSEPRYAISNDGSLIAFESWTAARWKVRRQISVHRIGTGKKVASFLAGDEELAGSGLDEKNEGTLSGEGRMLRFSPDGSHIAYRFSRNSKDREAKKNLAIRVWKLPQ